VMDIFLAVGRHDSSRLADRLIDITAPTRPVDRAAITSEIDRMLSLYVDVALARVRFGEAVNDLLRLVRDNGLRLPGNLVQFFKALSMCEGILREIEPGASLSDYVRPIVEDVSHRGAHSIVFATPHSMQPVSGLSYRVESTVCWAR